MRLSQYKIFSVAVSFSMIFLFIIGSFAKNNAMSAEKTESLSSDRDAIDFINEGEKSNRNKEWYKGIWYYKEYIKRHPEDEAKNRELLIKIAEIYFSKL